jgi:hypothetical protein
MYEIKFSATVIHRLTYGELFEFLLAILQHVDPFLTQVPRLQIRYDALNDVFIIYDNGFKRPLSAPETEEIRTFDIQRRGVFILIDDAVRKNAHYSVIPEVQAAAKGLLPIFDNYAGTPTTEYENETGAIINMIQELKKPENLARITRLAQAENLAALEQINNDFQAFYQSRLKNRYDFKQEGNTRQRANNLIDELTRIGITVNGLMLSASDPDEIDALKQIIAFINALMEQYTIIVHRRIGVKSSKKKDDSKTDEETQAPDTTNPPAPDTPPQAPDTTVPPAPETPPQAPDTTVPPINPEDLNPPAAGE